MGSEIVKRNLENEDDERREGDQSGTKTMVLTSTKQGCSISRVRRIPEFPTDIALF